MTSTTRPARRALPLPIMTLVVLLAFGSVAAPILVATAPVQDVLDAARLVADTTLDAIRGAYAAVVDAALTLTGTR